MNTAKRQHWIRRLTPAQIGSKLWKRVLPNLHHLTKTRVRRCRCCRRISLFLQFDKTEEFRICLRCRANLRYEMLGEYIDEKFPDLTRHTVWELDPFSPLRRRLESAHEYSRTFYDRDLQAGTLNADGASMQDVTRTTFPDKSFDLIISSDVLEHVPNVEGAFAEFHRVLKPGGICIFTVPPNEKTIRRALLGGDGSVRHLTEPEYHSDPLNPDGILAFWSFGADMPDYLFDSGLEFDVVKGPEGSTNRIIWQARRPNHVG
jgi:SAM-dependent methyltransferase